MTTLDGLFACGYDVIVFVDETGAGSLDDSPTAENRRSGVDDS